MILSIPLISIDKKTEIKDVKMNIAGNKQMRLKGKIMDNGTEAPFDFVVYSYKFNIEKVSILTFKIDGENYLKRNNLKIEISFNIITRKYILKINSSQVNVTVSNFMELYPYFIKNIL